MNKKPEKPKRNHPWMNKFKIPVTKELRLKRIIERKEHLDKLDN